MKRFNILLSLLIIAVLLCGCGKGEKATKKETVSISVMQDGQPLESSGYDIMLSVNGKEITPQKNDAGYTFEKTSGEIRGSVKFHDWVEVEYGFENNSAYSDIAINISYEHKEEELYASQTVSFTKNGEASQIFSETTADMSESRLSVFYEGGN